jgi:serine protease Do
VPQLEKQGYVTRGYLGVGIQDLSPALAKYLGVPEGALVSNVTENSPASKAGLKEEDVITSIDGEKVGTSTALTRVVALKRPDTTVTMSVIRGGKAIEAKVKLGVRPDLENLGELDRKPSEQPTDTHSKRLGISFQELDPRMAEATGLSKQGALIVDVAPGSAAESAGLHRGMVIVEVNHRPVRNRDDLLASLKEIKSGNIAMLRIATPGSSARNLLALEVP